MITNWITSIFNLLGIQILESYTIFGISLDLQRSCREDAEGS